MAIEKYKEFLKVQYNDYMQLSPQNAQVPHHYVNILKI